MINLGIADLLLFSVVNAMNILTFFIFVSRVKWPNIVHKLAIAMILWLSLQLWLPFIPQREPASKIGLNRHAVGSAIIRGWLVNSENTHTTAVA
jgi:hypothetical protein